MIGVERGEFLKLSGMLAGALIIGFGEQGCSNQSAAPAGSPLEPNQWVAVRPDGAVIVNIAKSEMGQGAATGLATCLAEELDVPMSSIQMEFPVASPAYADPDFFNLQMTGGSTSLQHSYPVMSQAGAAARSVLVAAAAKQWNVDPTSCKTSAGFVSGPSNQTASYASLVAAARSIPVPKNVVLKSPNDFILIGKPSARLDLLPKVTGQAQYGIDVRVPGMVYASVQQPPRFGATVKSFDASKAKQVSGVIDVVEIPKGVAVVATNTWAAFAGRKALTVEWTPGLDHLDTDELYVQREDLARSRRGTLVFVNRGDVEAAGGSSIEAVYKTPYLAHAPMEPMNATAHVTSDGVEVWAPTQNQTQAIGFAAKTAGVATDKVILHTTYLGGAFGRRLVNDFVTMAVAVSKATSRPVKVMWTREDDTQHDFLRPLSVNFIRGAVGPNGRVVALDHVAVAEAPVASILPLQKPGFDPSQTFGMADSGYDIPNFRAAYTFADAGVPTTTMRAPGANQNSFAVESFIDELAHVAGKDPVAFRLDLLKGNPRYATVLQTCAKNAGWGHPKTAGARQGVAFAVWDGTPTAGIVEVTIDSGNPVVHRVTVVADPGLVVNPDIVDAQLTGGVNFGLSMALLGNITIKGGTVQQANFDTYNVLHMMSSPEINAAVIPSNAPSSGIGEVTVPPMAPAVANAIFALTGKRIRTLPFI